MKFRFLFILFIFISAAFTPDLSLLKTIKGNADFFTSDNLGNIYIVKNDLLEKYDKEGNFLKSFSNELYGNITSVDAGNSLKIVLFYKESLQTLFLDNNLSPIGKNVSLEFHSLSTASLLSYSSNHTLWLYDENSHDIIGFTDGDKTSSGDLNQLLNISLKPNFLLERNNRVFLNNPETGILVFDIFGAYSKTIPIKNLLTFQPTEEKIYYVKNKYLKTYDIKTMAEDSILLPDTSAISARIEKNRMYIQTPEAIKIFEIK